MTLHAMMNSGNEDLKLFFRFLKENNIYSTYFKRLKKDKDPENSFNCYYEHNIEYFFSKCRPMDWLTSCFVWGKQPEGRCFWSRYNNLWCRHLSHERGHFLA